MLYMLINPLPRESALPAALHRIVFNEPVCVIQCPCLHRHVLHAPFSQD